MSTNSGAMCSFAACELLQTPFSCVTVICFAAVAVVVLIVFSLRNLSVIFVSV